MDHILWLIIMLSGTALADRDWSQVMTMPTEGQPAQPGTLRSPYITFIPALDAEGFTACARDPRIRRGIRSLPPKAAFPTDRTRLEWRR